jgi:hypothetical protein
VNPALTVLAAITIGGAVLAVSARDVRTTTLGLLLVLLGAPLIDTPWPGPLPILARIAATLLAIRLVVIGLRGDSVTGGTRLGWPTEALLAAAAAVIGFGSHGLGAAGFGPPEAQAAGFALIVLAIAPLAAGREVLRIAVGSVLLVVGAGLVRAGLGGTARDAEQLVWAVLTIALGGAVAVIAAAARAAGGADLSVPIGAGGWQPRPPDAHRAPSPEHRVERGPERETPRRPPAGPSAGPSGRARRAAGRPRPPADGDTGT